MKSLQSMEGEEQQKEKYCPPHSGEKKSHSFSSPLLQSPLLQKEYSFHHNEKIDMSFSSEARTAVGRDKIDTI